MMETGPDSAGPGADQARTAGPGPGVSSALARSAVGAPAELEGAVVAVAVAQLQDLPPEVIERVLFFLDLRSLGRAAMACRALEAARWIVCDTYAENPSRRGNPSVLWLLQRDPRYLCLRPFPVRLRVCAPAVDHTAVCALATSLTTRSGLVHLALPDCGILPNMVLLLASALRQNTALRSLSLSTNALGDEAAVTLAAGLQANRGLQRLFLFDNDIGDEGACALALMLNQNHTLCYMDLGYNQIGNVGAMCLAETLNASSIQRIRLLHNRISDNGCCALAKMLEGNTQMATFELQDNDIGDDGAAAMARVLETNTTLLDLSLHMNKRITTYGLRELHAGLTRNTTLHTIALYNFRFDPAVVTELFGDKGDGENALEFRQCRVWI